ncbi:hypothetical protein JOQ06_015334 [Pogonophryne albipinna]|uniref:trypsin n=1 Tax=Pogonophryne albipinna TaxID=1090488 RepID=A0AAD6AMS5_9TELE|nr:hypothetical protein JOQ06_015334 [Pogonophryne albipinna]
MNRAPSFFYLPLLLLLAEGGVYGQRIIGGDVVQPNSISFQASLLSHMIQLDRPAVLNSWVGLVSLPEPDSLPLADRARCTVSGWGVTSLNSYSLSPELRSVDVDMFRNCWYYYYFRITENMICAGSRSGGKDSCQVSNYLGWINWVTQNR